MKRLYIHHLYAVMPPSSSSRAGQTETEGQTLIHVLVLQLAANTVLDLMMLLYISFMTVV